MTNKEIESYRNSYKVVNGIGFCRVNNDINGNPRYVVHFLAFTTDEEMRNDNLSQNQLYMTTEEIRMLTKKELVAEYERTIKWYKEHNINRNFSKYAEMFWILFDDGANSYMWAIDTICSWFPECNKEELEKEFDGYI